MPRAGWIAEQLVRVIPGRSVSKDSMTTIDRHTRLPQKLAWLLGLLPALALVVLAADMAWGGGHPPLGAVLVSWALYPTLTGYLSRALIGSTFPSFFIILLGLMEYPMVGFGLGSLIVRARGWTGRRIRVGVMAFVGYLSLQLAAHVLLNVRTVNVHLLTNANPAISGAAVDRIRDAGDTASLPILQEKFVDEFERQGLLTGDNLLDALTQLGGAKGWQDLLESGRLGVAGRVARTWRFVINNVREMANPAYAASRGGVHSPHLRDEDVSRLFDALALKLARHLELTPDGEAALTLLTLMKGRPDLCSKYLQTVPNGLRDQMSQVIYEIVGNLAAMRSGRPPDSAYNYQVFLSKDEIARIGREQTAIAGEWADWVKADRSACHGR